MSETVRSRFSQFGWSIVFNQQIHKITAFFCLYSFTLLFLAYETGICDDLLVTVRQLATFCLPTNWNIETNKKKYHFVQAGSPCRQSAARLAAGTKFWPHHTMAKAVESDTDITRNAKRL